MTVNKFQQFCLMVAANGSLNLEDVDALVGLKGHDFTQSIEMEASEL